MKIAYFDCFSGAAGDMILGALIDAGLRLADVEREIAKLQLEGFRLTAGKVTRAGISGTKFDVLLAETNRPADDSHDNPSHGHHHNHGRGLAEILPLIEQSALARPVKRMACDVFRCLAAAEGEVHAKPPEEIHFHEVGAIDAIVDIVGTAAALHLLGVDRVCASPLRLGSGSVRCGHGELPVPAPATALLVRNIPVIPTDIQGELTTPTGAAILATVASEFGPMPACRIEAVGYGAGSRDVPGRPNLLRVFIGQTVEGELDADVVEVIEANLDDMSPEFFGGVFDRLFDAGALDVFVMPIQMKKGRPALLLTVLAPPGRTTFVQEVIFRETTTFGVRIHEARRRKLPRETCTVSTPLGDVRMKVGRMGGRIVRAKPEHDDCTRIARERGVPFARVHEAAMEAWKNAMKNEE
ncbi:MAG TPA: nickel pincer cofactor biosynthesis protein LarC [Planctomycetota bacterium]|nr:nickel pincer cofactor biosynthesis protein LarC [Planctomycetota bacterium]